MKRYVIFILFLAALPMISCEDADVSIPENIIIQINANPPTVQPDTSSLVEGWGQTIITVRVLNSTLDPLEGIGVILTADPSGIFQSTEESITNPIRTDSNGRASDILHTDAATNIAVFTGDHSADVDIGFGMQGAAPVAVLFAEPNPAKAGTSVVFDGSTSFDLDGAIMNYRWEITPDIDPAEVLEGPNILVIIRQYNIQQNVDVTLTVTDNSGDTDIDSTIEEIVANLPPTADAGIDQAARLQAGSVLVTLDHSQSQDPDGLIVRVQWDCDNGTFYDVPPGQPFGQCTYTATGDYFPEVTVWDDGNGDPGYPDQKSDIDLVKVTITS
jgi:hypothetical protein